MNNPHRAPAAAEGQLPSSPTRRRVLASLLSAYTATLVPWALAQPIADEQHGAFLALSALLAGRQSLDSVLGTRLYEALRQNEPEFAVSAQALLTLINERKIDPLDLQKILNEEKSPYAALPRQIVTAWYLGVVGSGAQARVLAYEHALNAVVVSDVLKPPTYAYGEYASWERKPT